MLRRHPARVGHDAPDQEAPGREPVASGRSLAKGAEQPAPSGEQVAAAPVPAATRAAVVAWLARAYLTWLPPLIVVVGAAIRVREYSFRRSLWLDESLIALNLVQRSYRGLLEPLDLRQAAPAGWLWAERAVIGLLGRTEYGLRLIPMLAGIGALLGVWWVARRLLPDWLVPVALALAACSPFLLYYSNEAKQYETDATIGLGLLIASMELLRDRPGWRRMLVWAGLGAVAVWCSHPAVLLLAGYAAALAVVHLLRRNWVTLAQLAGAAVVCGSSFLAVYAVSLGSVRDDPQLSEWWRDGFVPQPLEPSSALGWLGRRSVEFVANPLGLAPPLAVAAVLALGAAALLRSRPTLAMLLLAPLPVFVGAAAIQAYPVRSRLLLVLVPTVLLVAAAAPDWSGGGLAGLSGRVAGLVLLGGLLLAPAADALRLLGDPTTVEELRPVMEQVKERSDPGERIWVYRGAGSPFAFYAPSVGLHADAGVVRRRSPVPCGRIRTVLRRASMGSDRLWVVFGHHFSSWPPNERAIFLSRMDLIGRQVDAVHAPGAVAYRYDLTGPPADPTGARLLPVPSTRNCYKIE